MTKDKKEDSMGILSLIFWGEITLGLHLKLIKKGPKETKKPAVRITLMDELQVFCMIPAITYFRTGRHYHRLQELNCRVRNGNECGLLDIVTGNPRVRQDTEVSRLHSLNDSRNTCAIPRGYKKWQRQSVPQSHNNKLQTLIYMTLTSITSLTGAHYPRKAKNQSGQAFAR